MQRLHEAEPNQNQKGNWTLLIADLRTFSTYEEFQARFRKLINERGNKREDVAILLKRI
jgi:hypothetical protein